MVDAAWVALSLADHVGGKKLRALLRHFADPTAILNADETELRRVPGIGPKTAAIIHALQPDALRPQIATWRAAGVRMVGLFDADYPSALAALEDAPPTLFVTGGWPLTSRAVAVVGTRQPSPLAEHIARQLGSTLAERGFAVVSGLALGIDRAAHIGALAVPTGTTWAVLGSGVHTIYPDSHRALASAIAGRGTLLSEVAPHARPNRASLVARNRIISGLCAAVIVVESSADGGAMHAARRAAEQGRAVYALDIGASGNRTLLAGGAIPIAPDLRDFMFS